MNINAAARSRAMLSALGIPVWASRDVATISIDPASFPTVWHGEVIDEAKTPQPVVKQSSTGTTQPIPPVQAKSLHADIQPARHTESVATAKQIDTSVPRSQHVQVATTAETASSLDSALRFGLQCCVGTGQFGHWLLTIPEADLNNQQAKQLLQNIMLAIGAQSVEVFHWPFAESERWLHREAAEAAVAGLMFRLMQQQPVDAARMNVALIGKPPINIVTPATQTVFASLPDMLINPLLKRTLWQALSAPRPSESLCYDLVFV